MRRLNRYELGEELGSGASARVCRAYDTDLKRSVAVKVMHKHLRGEPSFVQRFRAEALAVASLQHPNILQVYDVSPEDAEELYFVTELVEGGTVGGWLNDSPGGKLPHEAALCVALQVLRGLEAAHQASIIHRDLKPENLMLDEAGHVKIADFGIAHRPGGGGESTVSGALLGSPAYMSPEQVDGETVDARSDLFAFGSLFYRMVTGELPFGESPVTHVLHRIAEGDYAPVRQVEPTLDPRIAEAIEACLATEPGKRPRSAKDVIDKLAAIAQLRGIHDPAEEIVRYRSADDEERKKLSYATVQTLVDEAKGQIESQKDPTLAMALVDRALEIQPFHFEAYRLLQHGAEGEKNRFKAIAVILLVIAVVAGAAWFVVYTLETDRQASHPQPTAMIPSPLIQPQPLPGTFQPEQPASPGANPPANKPTDEGESEAPARNAAPQRRTASEPPPKPAPTGTLHLITRPWAEIYVDNETASRGKTPFVQSLELSEGEHNIRLKNPQTKLTRFTVVIEPGKTIEKIIELKALPGILMVRAATGESVFLNGERLDQASLGSPFEIEHGKHVVRFQRGDESREIVVRVGAGREATAVSPFGEALQSAGESPGEP